MSSPCQSGAKRNRDNVLCRLVVWTTDRGHEVCDEYTFVEKVRGVHHRQRTQALSGMPSTGMRLHAALIWISDMTDQVASADRAIVLIVEDESLLRKSAVGIVERAGFVALEAEDADEAIALLEARSDIAVIFTDINLPGSLDGLKLAHAVRHRWPPLKILIVSGEASPKPSQLPSNSTFLRKPYRANAVIAQLRSLVAAA